MRNVRIATTSYLVEDYPHTIEMNIERSVRYVREAGAKKVDILCLPEMVTTANVPAELEYFSEDYPGEFTRAFRKAAKEELKETNLSLVIRRLIEKTINSKIN